MSLPEDLLELASILEALGCWRVRGEGTPNSMLYKKQMEKVRGVGC